MLAILQDKKGFRAYREVPRFPPVIDVAILPPLTANNYYLSKESSPCESLNHKKISFFPKGEPKESFGEYILLYLEQ